MVLQARNKHREAAPKPPRASRSPLRAAPDAGAEEPGPERAPPSPGRKGAAGRKGPRAEPVAPPAGGGLRGRLAAGLRGALGLRRASRVRTWTTLLLGEQPQRTGAAGSRNFEARAAPLPLPSAPLPPSRSSAPPARLCVFATLSDFSWDFLTSSSLSLPPGSGFLAPLPSTLSLCLKKKKWPRDQQLPGLAAN